MSKYRLSPKPGIIRAGKFVKTNATPSMSINKNVVRIQQAPKVPKVKSAKPPTRPPKPNRPTSQKQRTIRSRANKRKNPNRRSNRNPRNQSRYNQAIKDLKGTGIGKILIMVACGPSLDEVDFSPIKGHSMIDVMLINRPFEELQPANYWVFCDQSQYIRNKETFEKFDGTIINTWSVRARHKNQIMVKNRPGRGFSKDLLQGYHIGRSTTYANMQTALWMNYDRIYIFGCDMDPNGAAKFGKLHYYGTNPDVDPKIRAKRFESEAKHYANAAKILSPSEKSKFVFCSAYNPWPFVNEFKKLDHREAINVIFEEAEKLSVIKNRLDKKPEEQENAGA